MVVDGSFQFYDDVQLGYDSGVRISLKIWKDWLQINGKVFCPIISLVPRKSIKDSVLSINGSLHSRKSSTP